MKEGGTEDGRKRYDEGGREKKERENAVGREGTLWSEKKSEADSDARKEERGGGWEGWEERAKS
jgi:hypothetical protein